jgi:hypothetical protein
VKPGSTEMRYRQSSLRREASGNPGLDRWPMSSENTPPTQEAGGRGSVFEQHAQTHWWQLQTNSKTKNRRYVEDTINTGILCYYTYISISTRTYSWHCWWLWK